MSLGMEARQREELVAKVRAPTHHMLCGGGIEAFRSYGLRASVP